MSCLKRQALWELGGPGQEEEGGGKEEEGGGAEEGEPLVPEARGGAAEEAAELEDPPALLVKTTVSLQILLPPLPPNRPAQIDNNTTSLYIFFRLFWDFDQDTDPV